MLGAVVNTKDQHDSEYDAHITHAIPCRGHKNAVLVPGVQVSDHTVNATYVQSSSSFEDKARVSLRTLWSCPADAAGGQRYSSSMPVDVRDPECSHRRECKDKRAKFDSLRTRWNI